MKKKNLTTAIALGLMTGVATTSTALAQGTDRWSGINAKFSISSQRIEDDKKDIEGGWEDCDPDCNYPYPLDKDASSTSTIASASIGYDKQMSDRFVVGIFAEYDFGSDDVSASATYEEGIAACCQDYTVEDTTTVKNTLSLGVKLGALINEDNLVYVTAGISRSKVKTNSRFTGSDEVYPPLVGKGSSTEGGNFIGIGIEHKYQDNINFSLEYRHTDYGTVGRGYDITYNDYAAVNNTSDARSSLSTDKITFGVSYNFY